MTNEAKPNQIQDKPPTSTPPSIDENKKNTTSQYNSLRSLSIDQPYLELTPLLSTGAASSTTKPSNASHSTIDAKNKGIAGNANRYLHKNINQRSKKFAQRFVKTQHYQANVIPIVKSKRNMVIVGAVLRSDLMRSVRELKRVIDIANTPPVCFIETCIYSENIYFCLYYFNVICVCCLHIATGHSGPLRRFEFQRGYVSSVAIGQRRRLPSVEAFVDTSCEHQRCNQAISGQSHPNEHELQSYDA